MLRLTIINYKTIAKGAEVYMSHMGQAFAPGFSFADAPVKQFYSCGLIIALPQRRLTFAFCSCKKETRPCGSA